MCQWLLSMSMSARVWKWHVTPSAKSHFPILQQSHLKKLCSAKQRGRRGAQRAGPEYKDLLTWPHRNEIRHDCPSVTLWGRKEGVERWLLVMYEPLDFLRPVTWKISTCCCCSSEFLWILWRHSHTEVENPFHIVHPSAFCHLSYYDLFRSLGGGWMKVAFHSSSAVCAIIL